MIDPDHNRARGLNEVNHMWFHQTIKINYILMKKIFYLLILILVLGVSCGRSKDGSEDRIITVSIAPFKYFVTEIAGDNFKVNVMVPPGANPHIYEPFPDQITRLTKSEGYISDGYLGFEMTWLDRFYEMNKTMSKLSLADGIEMIKPEHHHEGESDEGADPHYWVSPVCALTMASSVKRFLVKLDPENSELYEANYLRLCDKINEVGVKAKELSAAGNGRAFMIYHPNLAYLARDYGLEEIPVENEGKEPTPFRMKELIDRAVKDSLKVILVQKEYDTKNARAIADETGSTVVIIDPLSEDWYGSTMNIIKALKDSFENRLK